MSHDGTVNTSQPLPSGNKGGTVFKAFAVTAGGIGLAVALTAGFAWGTLVGILTDDPQEWFD